MVPPTFNQWHSQGPPKLLQPGLVPCDPMTNSPCNATAMSQAQPQQPSQPLHSPPTISAMAAAAAAYLDKVKLTQSNLTLTVAEPSTAP